MSPQVVSLGQEDRQDHLCGAADGDRQTDRQTRTHTHTHSAGFPRFPLDTLICQAAGTNHLLHNVREPPPCTSPPPQRLCHGERLPTLRGGEELR